MLVEVIAWIVGAVALFFATSLGHKQFLVPSRICMFVVAILVTVCAIMPLLPNYVATMNIDTYYQGCGSMFDAYVHLVVNAVFGSTFAALLGLMLFAILFTLPISAVRGVWLLLLPPNDANVDECSRNGMFDILCGLIRFLGCLIPAITVFPLLFCTQLSEDDTSLTLLQEFWLVPPLILVCCSSGDSVRTLTFYLVWLALYLFLFCRFLLRQIDILDQDLAKILANADYAWLWSMMHVDFCISNVVVTDIIYSILDSSSVEQREDVGAHIELVRMEGVHLLLINDCIELDSPDALA